MSADDSTPLPADAAPSSHQPANETGTYPTNVGTAQASAQYAQASDSHTSYGQAPYGQTSASQIPYGQTPWNRQPYGSAPTFTYPPTSSALIERLKTNSMIVLVLGIFGIILIGLFGSIPAWVWGDSILSEAQANGIHESYVSNAKVGRILGIVGTIMWAFGTLLVLLAILAFIFLAAGEVTQSISL